MQYTIEGSDLLHNGELYPEGSEVELTDKEARKLGGSIKLIPLPVTDEGKGAKKRR